MLKIENLKKHYDNFFLECSLQVNPGQVTGLIGQNGSGKSTTFKAILDLIHPDGGSITLFGKDNQDITPEDKEKLGVVLSNSGFSGYLRIKDIIPILENMYRQFDSSFFIKQVQRFSLPMDKQIKDFSTGMKAKLKVLVAISHGAKLLILDEPTAGLDPKGRDKILNRIKELHDNTGIGVVLVSHSMEDVANYAQRLIVINNGKIKYDGMPKDVFKHYKELEKMGLKAPQITYIMHKLKEKGLDVDENVITIEEARENIMQCLNRKDI